MINFISEINDIQIDNAQDLDAVIEIYNSMAYSDNYSKISGRLWKYCRDESVNDNETDSESFKFKARKTDRTLVAGNTNNVERALPLWLLSKFLRTLEVPQISCDINIVLAWSENCVITDSTSAGWFAINYATLYAPAVALSTKDNIKLLQKLKKRFKRIFSLNKYNSNFLLQT